MRCIAIVAPVFLLLGASCKERPAPVDETAAVAGQAQPTGAEAPVEPQAVVEPEQAYLTFVTILRREPTDAKRIEDSETKKRKLNWLMTLYRGEQVEVLEVEGDWARARASDGTEGWVKKSGLLPSEGVTPATVYEETKSFSRPDLLAQNTSRTLDTGSLLFVLKSKDQFTEVNYYGQSSVWVLSEALVTEPKETAAAKLLAKVRWLKERKDADAAKVMELARTQFGDSKLISMADEDAEIKSGETQEEKEEESAADPGDEPADTPSE